MSGRRWPATAAGSRVILVHVERAPMPPLDAPLATLEPADVLERSLAAIDTLLDELLRSEGLEGQVEKRAELGLTVDRLIETASEVNAAMIVLGSRGHHGLGSLLGSISNEVSSLARCPVLVVPPDAEIRI
ncbi:MAG: universal stress protein [Gaiellales bacterium]